MLIMLLKRTLHWIQKIKIINRETTFIDALLYKFNYSITDKTKDQIAGEINLLNNKNTFLNSFNYREI